MSSDHVLQPIEQDIFFGLDPQPGLVEDTDELPQVTMDGPESSAIQTLFNPQNKAQYGSGFDWAAEIANTFFGADQSVGFSAGQDRENQSGYCSRMISGSGALGEDNGHSTTTDAEKFLLSNLVAENSFQTHDSHSIFDTSPRKEAMEIKKRRRTPCTRQTAGGPHLSSSRKVEKIRRETQDMRKLSKTATTACYLLLSSTSKSKPSERRIRALSRAFKAPLHLLHQWFYKHAECLQDEGVREQTQTSTESFMSLKLRKNQRKCDPSAAGGCAKPWIKDENMPYLCTCCGRNFERKGDWKRHEELNFPQEFWLCQILPCQAEPMEKQTYLRKDKFRIHLTKRHDIVPTNEYIETCHFLVESEFPRICIFRDCSIEFTTWSARVDHITEHMRRPWTFSEWRDFDDGTNEEDKTESSGSDTSEGRYGSDSSNNDSDYPDDAPDNGPDGSSRDHDDSFGADYEPDIDYRSFQTGQSSSNQAQGSGTLGPCYSQHYRQCTHILPETSISYIFGSKLGNPLICLPKQKRERLFLTSKAVCFQQSDLEAKALKDRHSTGYVNANTETQNTFNSNVTQLFETVEEETLVATTIPQSNLHSVTAMRKRPSLGLQLIPLRQLQTEPPGYSIRRFLEEESESRITRLLAGQLQTEPPEYSIRRFLKGKSDTRNTRLLAGQTYLSNTTGYQTWFYNMSQHQKSSTSMLLSGTDSLAALTSEPSVSTTSLSSSIGIRSLGVPRLLESPGGINGALEISSINPRTQFECPFSFQFCLLIFNDFDEWFRHSLKHFHQAGPPTFSKCGFCDMQFSTTKGLECWKARMEHVALHHRVGARLAHARPDFELFKYLWSKKLIDSADYKSLLGHVHRGEHSRFCDSPSISPVDDHESTAVTYTCVNNESRRKRDRKPRGR